MALHFMQILAHIRTEIDLKQVCQAKSGKAENKPTNRNAWINAVSKVNDNMAGDKTGDKSTICMQIISNFKVNMIINLNNEQYLKLITI